MTTTTTPLLTVDDVAAMFGVNPETVRREVRRGNLNGVKIGALLRFRQSDIDAYLDSKATG